MGDESGLAPTTEVKPRLDVQEEEIPFTMTRENPLCSKENKSPLLRSRTS